MYNNLIRSGYVLSFFIFGFQNTALIICLRNALNNRSVFSLLRLFFFSVFYFYGFGELMFVLLTSVLTVLIVNYQMISDGIEHLKLYTQLIRNMKDDKIKENSIVKIVDRFDKYHKKITEYVKKVYDESSTVKFVQIVMVYLQQLGINKYLQSVENFLSYCSRYVLNKLLIIPIVQKLNSAYDQLPDFPNSQPQSIYNNEDILKEMEHLSHINTTSQNQTMNSQNPMMNFMNMPPPTEEEMQMFGAMMIGFSKLMEESNKKLQ